MRLGIDASNVGGGGGVTHLKELLQHFDSIKYQDEISSIILFASQTTLDSVDDFNGLKKITFPELNKGLLKRVIFQLTNYDKFIKEECDVLLSITGDYVGSFKPVVGMSRNMLLYEREIWKEIKKPKEIIRFWLNFHKQKKSFKNSSGIIFISNYAKNFVSQQLNLKDKRIEVIHHGVSLRFKNNLKEHIAINQFSKENPFLFAYVSTVHVYKHQWNVIEAVNLLHQKGYPVKLQLVGGIIFEPAGKKMLDAIQRIDPNHDFIDYKGHMSYQEIDSIYKQANGLIFASTCENMPNTLLECMSAGVAIACSDKQPMPEFLKENGYYFNAYNIESIFNALEKLLKNPETNNTFAQKNLEEVEKFTWETTAKKTFDFLIENYKSYKKCAE